MTCHHDLQRLIREVAKSVEITVICGHREKAAQDHAFAVHASKLQWPHSRHNSLPSEAVDIAPLPVAWDDLPSFKALAVVVKECAARLGVEVQWGGDFPHFQDFDHFQLKAP